MTLRACVGAGLASLALFALAFFAAGGGSPEPVAPPVGEVPATVAQASAVTKLRAMPPLPNLPKKPKPKVKKATVIASTGTSSSSLTAPATGSGPATSSAPSSSSSSAPAPAKKSPSKSSGGNGDVCFGPLC